MGHVNEKSAHATLANSNFAKDPTSKKPHNVVYFRLPEEITAATLAEGKDKLYDRYLKPIYEEHDGKLYYRYLVKIHDDSGSPEEWITGYCQIAMGTNPQDSYGLIGSSPYQQAWITLQDVPVQEDVNNSYSTNPIMNQAWQFMRLSAPRNLFGNNVLSGTSVLNGIDIPSMVKAMNKVLYNKKICRSFIPEKSCIRIGAGGKKKGGGSRVKKILFYDQFNAMTGNKEIGSVYGMEYEYKSETGESYGVASYEPLIGNDENPLKKGEEYVVERDKLPDEKLYHFSPIGEQFYEGAQVGYSEVKVKSIEYSGVERNATGYTIHNFYTSKDAPVINRKTAITTIPIEQGKTVIDGIFMRERVSTATMSQGFLIRKVHLAGKPEKVTSYSNDGAEIGSTNFEYTSSVPLRVVNNDGTHELAFMNREVDFFADAYSTLITNDNKSIQIGGGMKNYKPFVSVFTSVNKSFEGYYFNTFTKVIEDYPILAKVESHFQGAKTISLNLAWDAQTGSPLVTKSMNDHNQSIYSVEYPSHWAYSNAKPKYLTADNHAENITITSGVANLSGTGYAATDLINVGDQIMITNSSGVNSLAWASYVSGSTVTLVDRTGTKLTTTSSNNTLRVLTPNTKADPSTPMMSYITLNNPIGVSSLNAPTGILSAGALSMKDCWETVSAYNFGCTPSSSECGFTEGTAINPWVTGVSGNLRPNLFYTYQVDRLENSVSVTPEVDLRSGGKYNSFIPFYAYSSGAGKYVPINNPSHPNYNAGSLEKWLIASQIIHYNEHGVPIESKDVLGNYSGVIFGYSNTLKILPVASAEFARYTDIASDGFEDYLFRSDLANCPNLDGHFDFKKVVSVSDLSSTEYHTGRFSLKIASGANFTVNRKLYSVSDEIPCSTPQEGKGEYSASSGQNLKGFSPKTGLYQFSIWAKQNTTNLYTAVPDAKIEIKVSYPGIDSITTLSAVESPIIEGWQKIEGTFRVSTNATCITVKLYHSATTAGNVFFDDLRIHPHNSNMIAVVYDPFTLRSWAVLDDRNYATIYEYDENGMVVRVKRETIDGIKTIAESRKSLKK
ncbi:MAG TPA: hypothetical protein DEP18_02030 [Flavobacteriales bacterium]|nr:hypothetical protein [Flavobacteriales bacterium]